MAHTNRTKRTPARWPSDLKYLHVTTFSSSIPSDVLQFIKGTAFISTADRDALPNPPVAIRRIDNPAHPAYKQMGLFASKKIPPLTHILDYLGEVHVDDRASSDYDLSLYRTQLQDGVSINVGIDAACMGNEARFINDYRRVRPKPNALFTERRTQGGELRISIWSDTEAIKKGDEILVSYGKSWWQARQESMP